MDVESAGGGRVLVAGPSGSPDHPAISARVVVCRSVGLAGADPGGGRLVVENCTVDASIFCDCRPAEPPAAAAAHVSVPVRGAEVRGVCCSCVAKLLRAHGGCLGTRSR